MNGVIDSQVISYEMYCCSASMIVQPRHQRRTSPSADDELPDRPPTGLAIGVDANGDGLSGAAVACLVPLGANGRQQQIRRVREGLLCRILATMTGAKCWDCGMTAHMTPIDGAVSVTRKGLRYRVHGCFRCDGCQALNIAVATGLPGNENPLVWLARKKNKEWLPKPTRVIPVMSFPDVPAEIAAAASEAYRCRTVANANRAAILLARSVIEATAKDKGLTSGSLIHKIDQMHDDRLIRPDVRDGAHEVRHLGNDMAHGDFIQYVSPEEADLVLTLMREVLVEVYQSPARVARAQASRQERARIAAAAAEGKPLYPGTTPELQRALLQLMNITPDQIASSPPEDAP